MKINKDFIWDYDFKESDLKKRSFKKWYIGRILVKGNVNDIKDIGYSLIKKFLPEITVPYKIREYWEWMLINKKGFKNDSKQRSKRNSFHNIKNSSIKG